MSQILHIFKKDTRRFWAEILLSTVILFAFVWAYPGKWKVDHDVLEYMRAQQFLGALEFLVPMSWWLLITRVVQAEAVVGNQQFWITRPYLWKNLLAAKCLFAVTWVGLPYLLAQGWLLTAAGFHTPSYISGMLYGLLTVLIVFVLPALALATVTSSFARATLTLLTLFVAYLVFHFEIDGPNFFPATHPYPNKALPLLLIGGCALAVLLQYAMRRTWLSRGILLALPILMIVSVIFYSRTSLIDEAYPQNSHGAAAPVTLTFAPVPDRPIYKQQMEGIVYVYLPVHYSDVADGSAVSLDDIRFTITASDGSQWSSPWHAHRDIRRILPDQHGTTVVIGLNPKVYDRFKSGPVTLNIAFAATRYKEESMTRTTFPAADAAIPGVGFCTPQFHEMPNLYCRAAINPPPLTYMTLMWSGNGCSDPAHLYDPEAKGNAWIDAGGFDTRQALVWTGRYWMGFIMNDELQKRHADWQICPGSPLTVTTYRWQGVGRTELTLSNFMLP